MEDKNPFSRSVGDVGLLGRDTLFGFCFSTSGLKGALIYFHAWFLQKAAGKEGARFLQAWERNGGSEGLGCGF